MSSPSPAPRPRKRSARRWSACACILLWGTRATAQDIDIGALLDMGLDDLMNVKVEVTTAAKKPQDVRDIPAAVYVLTGEDIRRSGATSLPEALRLVPGVLVRRINSHQWDVSIRGFNTGFSNKLLVMIDGRTVYTPLFAGVYWDVQDLLLEDVDRIEVIRGPGGAIWGANAVNGVINVITKSSRETEGTVVSALAGTEDRYILGVRDGGSFGESGTWRVYGKTFSRDGMELDGSGTHDDWSVNRGGFRMDWSPVPGDTATLQGDVYDGKQHDDRFVPEISDPGGFVEKQSLRVGGNNLLFRWMHKRSDDEEVTFQAYYDRTERDTDRLDEDRNTLDVEVTHHIDLGDTHDIVWGIGHRVTQAKYGNTDLVSITPDRRTNNIFNVFVQDEIAVGERTALTLGTKFEHNSYTEWEIQPTVRLAHRPDDTQTLWGAASRAVRTPSIGERDGRYFAGGFPGDPGDPDTTFAFVPGPDLESETLYAYEAGWRKEVSEDLSFDVALFYHQYSDLETEELGDAPVVVAPGVLEFQYTPANNMDGIGRGVELSSHWDVNDAWSLDASYTYLDLHLSLDDGSNDTFIVRTANDDPQNVFHLRSHHRLAERWQADVLFFHASKMYGTLDTRSNWRADVRVGYQPDERTDISFGVQNIFHDGQPDSYGNDAELAGYIKATRRF